MTSTNPVANLFRHLWKYSEGHRGKVIFFIILEFIANILQLGNAIAVSHAFNSVQFSSSDPKLLSHIILNLGILLVIIVVYWILHGISRVMENSNAFHVRKRYKQDMINKVLSLPLGWHKKHHSGDTIDKINKSAEALFNFSGSTFLINLSLVRVFGSLIAIFLFDRWAALIAGTVTVVAIYIVWRFDLYLRKTYLEIYKAENHLASAIHDYITNIFSIITLRLKDRVEREVLERSVVAYPTFQKQIRFNEAKWFSVGLFTTLMTFIVLSLNAYISYHTKGVIVIGTLFALYTYLQAIGGVFANFAMQYGQMVQNDAALRSAFIINEEYDKVSHTEAKPLPKNWNELEIKNLSFTYINEEADEVQTKHLENVNLVIKNKQKIAFIGESGSGKSTMLSLLRGLYPPEYVEVYCDGKKLPKKLRHVYEHTTLVPQEPELFNSTVSDNITMDTKVDAHELSRAIELAQFKSVLDRLPKGLDTDVLEKGISLSGGEKQRLALARGLIAGRNSDFLFLDEPTSSVDFTNETKIYQNILESFKDKTVISTIHNLSLLKYFDYIYLFRAGSVQAHGTFEEIMTNDAFKTLWENYSKAKETR
jgi:ABC-type multidrug transport system fused ATPase/permease subunit